jgi:hypothetical protein
METAQCQAGLICVQSICTLPAAAAPATSHTGLAIALGLLTAIAALALGRRRAS